MINTTSTRRSLSPVKSQATTARDRSRSPSRHPDDDNHNSSHDWIAVNDHYCVNGSKCPTHWTLVLCEKCLCCYNCCIDSENCTPVLVKPTHWIYRKSPIVPNPIPFAKDFPSSVVGELVIRGPGAYIACPATELSEFRTAVVGGASCDVVKTIASSPFALPRCHWAWNNLKKQHIWVGDQIPWYFTHNYFEYKNQVYEFDSKVMFPKWLCEKGLLPALSDTQQLTLLADITEDSAGSGFTYSQKKELCRAMSAALPEDALSDIKSTPLTSSSFARAFAPSPPPPPPSQPTSLPSLEKEDPVAPVVVFVDNKDEKTASALSSSSSAHLLCSECKTMSDPTDICKRCGLCAGCCGYGSHGGKCWACGIVLENSVAGMCNESGCKCEKCESCCLVFAKSDNLAEYKKQLQLFIL